MFHRGSWKIKRYRAAGMIMIAAALSGCGQQEDREPLAGQEAVEAAVAAHPAVPEAVQRPEGTSEDPDAGSSVQYGQQQADPTGSSPGDSSYEQPAYIGSWEVTDYQYPTTPCGLSQEEADAYIGIQLSYTPESFACGQKVLTGKGVAYEFSFYDDLAAYGQEYSVSVEEWFSGGGRGMVKCGLLTQEGAGFGDQFAYMQEQPDKMVISHHGVAFLAVRQSEVTGKTSKLPGHEAYVEVLDELSSTGRMPLGQDGGEESATIYFAIQDIDGDGRDELLIDYRGSTTATFHEIVYDYDQDRAELYKEIWDFPQILFYVGGYARSDWSHNHTCSDFWPYSLYRYDSSTDQYVIAYAVTAWDKERFPKDLEGNTFPDAADVSGTGRVFMIEDRQTGQVTGPIDAAAYEKWYSGILGKDGSKEVTVEWKLLSQEDLDAYR